LKQELIAGADLLIHVLWQYVRDFKDALLSGDVVPYEVYEGKLTEMDTPRCGMRNADCGMGGVVAAWYGNVGATWKPSADVAVSVGRLMRGVV